MPEIRQGPSFYATGRRGPWRDVRALLHLPYTLWNLAYVVLGAMVAARVNWTTLLATLAAFFLGLGVSAHAFDELQGRPLDTGLPAWSLRLAAIVGLGGAIALGAAAMALGRVGYGLVGFIVVGAFFVPAYNLELFGGRFHTDLAMAVVWGAMPILTSAYAQTGDVPLSSLFLALAGVLLIVAQRSLSTPVRLLRRRVKTMSGELTMNDDTTRPIDKAFFVAPAERALRAMSWAVMALAVALVLAHRGH